MPELPLIYRFHAVLHVGQSLFQEDETTQPDFLTQYLRVIFNTMGITSLHFFVVEGTVMGEERLQAQFRKLQTSLKMLLPSHIPL